MSIVSGTIGAFEGSKAQRQTAEKNLQAARETNEANYRLFQESRGSQGNAFLPLYMGQQERMLGQDAIGFYNTAQSLMGNPAQQLQRYNERIGAFMPMMDASRGTLADVFNGNLVEGRLQNAQPVADARNAFAKTQKQGVLEGLSARLNALNADSARKGYSGSGSFAQNRLLNATIGGRQAAAGVQAGANLENAMMMRDVQDQGALMKIQNMGMPYQQAMQALNLEMLPMSQVQQNFSRSLAPFEFFRMGPDNFQYAPLPQQPVIPSSAQIAATAAGNLGQQLGMAYLTGAFGGQGGGASANYSNPNYMSMFAPI